MGVARKGVLLAVCTAVMGAILVSCSKQTEIADCTRENVTSVGLLDGKAPVVCYYRSYWGLGG